MRLIRYRCPAVMALLPLALGLALAPQKATPAEEPNTRNIGSRLELFVDDWLIDRLDGLSLLLHQPTPREVVFRFDAPWEGPWSAYVTIIIDADRYRMYYRGMGTGNDPQVTCYAESRDGITWTRPELGLFDFRGSKANNIVWTGPGAHNLTPFKDTNPACSPDAQYKATGWGDSEPGRPLLAFKSADGIHWSRLRQEPVFTLGGFDSQNVAFWDPLRKQYFAYQRSARKNSSVVTALEAYNTWQEAEKRRAKTGEQVQLVRDILVATSTDFLNWTNPVFLDYGGAPLEQLYTNAITPYFRAPHIFLGFPKRFMPDRKVVTETKESGVSDALFMSSRDGFHWDRHFREAFIRPGLSRLNWMHRSNMVACGLVQTAPDEISLYSSEHYDTPENRLRRSTVRLDGFVSIHAPAGTVPILVAGTDRRLVGHRAPTEVGRGTVPFGAGQWVSKPLRFQGTHLVINYSTSAAGTIRAEVQEADGKPIPGYTLDDCLPIYGDELARAVRWKGGESLSAFQDRPIRLRFVMNDADLFSLRFGPAPGTCSKGDQPPPTHEERQIIARGKPTP